MGAFLKEKQAVEINGNDTIWAQCPHKTGVNANLSVEAFNLKQNKKVHCSQYSKDP